MMLLSTKIDTGELRDKYEKEIKKLNEFLEGKLKIKIVVAEKEMTLEPAENGAVVSKDHLRVLLRKFLHKEKLKEEFRVITGNEKILVIKARKLVE
jgi:phage gp36-like protein